MIEYKTPGQIEAIRVAGALVRRTLTTVRDAAAAGVRLVDLDDLAHQVIGDGGGVSAYIGYHPNWAPSPYPRVLCLSLNDVIVHAIPDETRVRPGDLVSADLALLVDGWCADAAISFTIGEPTAADRELIGTTEQALAAGIAAARPGGRLGDISAAVGAVIRASGFGLLADHGGHGIGTSMHQEPDVMNEGRAHRASSSGRAWSSPSNQCCRPAAATTTGTAPTAGGCGPPTGAARRMSSTPSRSPRRDRSS